MARYQYMLEVKLGAVLIARIRESEGDDAYEECYKIVAGDECAGSNNRGCKSLRLCLDYIYGWLPEDVWKHLEVRNIDKRETHIMNNHDRVSYCGIVNESAFWPDDRLVVTDEDGLLANCPRCLAAWKKIHAPKAQG